VGFPIDPFSKYCLLNGVDQLGFLLALEETRQYEETHTARVETTQFA
jgi:3-isopropylmalate/(R)-2-methylmalate dehydratase small subunit